MRRRWCSGVLRWLVMTVVALLIVPAAAFAAARSAPTLIFPVQQVWPLVIGGLVPLATYVLNRVGPWVSQPIKAGVLVVVSAAATALYTALATNVIGFNAPTLQLVLTGIAAALAAHHWLWKPSGVSTLLGAYADFGIHRSRGREGAPGMVLAQPAATTANVRWSGSVPAPGSSAAAPNVGQGSAPPPGSPGA